MKILGRDEILRADDLDYRDVPVPEWGADVGVRIRAGTGEERDAYDIEIIELNESGARAKLKRLRVKLLARAIVDEAGNRIFSEADLEALDKKNARVSWRLFKIAQSLWGISKEDVDELMGESKPGRNSEPGIVSPGNGASPILVTSDVN